VMVRDFGPTGVKDYGTSAGGLGRNPGGPNISVLIGPGEDGRVTKVQATSTTAGAGGETNRTAVRTVATAEDNRRPSDGCWEVQLPRSTEEAGERKDPVEGRG